MLLSDRAFLHCWSDFCLSLLEVFNLLFLQKWAFVLSFRVFEFEIRWTVIDESSFMEFKVLEVTPISYFQIFESVKYGGPETNEVSATLLLLSNCGKHAMLR